MNTPGSGAAFTVVVENQPSWYEWFSTREQALSYARLARAMVTERIHVLDCHGELVAELTPPESPRAPTLPPDVSAGSESADREAPLATPIR